MPIYKTTRSKHTRVAPPPPVRRQHTRRAPSPPMSCPPNPAPVPTATDTIEAYRNAIRAEAAVLALEVDKPRWSASSRSRKSRSLELYPRQDPITVRDYLRESPLTADKQTTTESLQKTSERDTLIAMGYFEDKATLLKPTPTPSMSFKAVDPRLETPRSQACPDAIAIRPATPAVLQSNVSTIAPVLRMSDVMDTLEDMSIIVEDAHDGLFGPSMGDYARLPPALVTKLHRLTVNMRQFIIATRRYTRIAHNNNNLQGVTESFETDYKFDGPLEHRNAVSADECDSFGFQGSDDYDDDDIEIIEIKNASNKRMGSRSVDSCVKYPDPYFKSKNGKINF